MSDNWNDDVVGSGAFDTLRDAAESRKQDVLIGEFVEEIREVLWSIKSMCASLHAPQPEPWNPAQHRVIAIVEKAIHDALSVIDGACGDDNEKRLDG